MQYVAATLGARPKRQEFTILKNKEPAVMILRRARQMIRQPEKLGVLGQDRTVKLIPVGVIGNEQLLVTRVCGGRDMNIGQARRKYRRLMPDTK